MGKGARGVVGAPAGHPAAALLPAPEKKSLLCFINACGANLGSEQEGTVPWA